MHLQRARIPVHFERSRDDNAVNVASSWQDNDAGEGSEDGPGERAAVLVAVDDDGIESVEDHKQIPPVHAAGRVQVEVEHGHSSTEAPHVHHTARTRPGGRHHARNMLKLRPLKWEVARADGDARRELEQVGRVYRTDRRVPTHATALLRCAIRESSTDGKRTVMGVAGHRCVFQNY